MNSSPRYSRTVLLITILPALVLVTGCFSGRSLSRENVPYQTRWIEEGVASWYGSPQRTASGGWFNPMAMTAAHKTLPFGSVVRVTRPRNGRSVVVTIDDRGPYIRGRNIDLSRRAAGKLDMISDGIDTCVVELLEVPPGKKVPPPGEF